KNLQFIALSITENKQVPITGLLSQAISNNVTQTIYRLAHISDAAYQSDIKPGTVIKHIVLL
ncbi:hypothetical protein, partial [Shewanella sp. Isolate7]|uniref:hypothetical protein n=3 Tax=Shewanella sp. Isolate7 TaxID=2908528 RepID=UPI001EFD9AC3